MIHTVFYKGHVIDIDEKNHYKITKDNKIIVVCDQIPFATKEDAELHAKMHLNKHTLRKDGWIIS